MSGVWRLSGRPTEAPAIRITPLSPGAGRPRAGAPGPEGARSPPPGPPGGPGTPATSTIAQTAIWITDEVSDIRSEVSLELLVTRALAPGMRAARARPGARAGARLQPRAARGALAQARALKAVLFDCDGVILESEGGCHLLQA